MRGQVFDLTPLRPPKRARLVYSSGAGRMCRKCGWPEADCRCSSSLGAAAPVPAKIRAALSIEKRGSGKVVTVIDGLPRNRDFLDSLARDLKRSCGTGGRVGRGQTPAGGQTPYLELQGDHRERLREILAKKGWTVKG